MFVAQRIFKDVDKNDNVTWYKPGDVIKTFSDWRPEMQRSLLQAKWVTEEAEEQPPVVQKKKSVTTKRRK